MFDEVWNYRVVHMYGRKKSKVTQVMHFYDQKHKKDIETIHLNLYEFLQLTN